VDVPRLTLATTFKSGQLTIVVQVVTLRHQFGLYSDVFLVDLFCEPFLTNKTTAHVGVSNFVPYLLICYALVTVPPYRYLSTTCLFMAGRFSVYWI
jgi:hypothetical protein